MSDGLNPMLMVREWGLGKVAYFNIAVANYTNTSPTEDSDWRDLLLGTVEWMNPCVNIFQDFDGDGFGNLLSPVEDCMGLGFPGYVDNAEDCDDTDPLVSPLVPEIWYDGIDQDCDGQSDYDADDDGYDRLHSVGLR